MSNKSFADLLGKAYFGHMNDNSKARFPEIPLDPPPTQSVAEELTQPLPPSFLPEEKRDFISTYISDHAILTGTATYIKDTGKGIGSVLGLQSETEALAMDLLRRHGILGKAPSYEFLPFVTRIRSVIKAYQNTRK